VRAGSERADAAVAADREWADAARRRLLVLADSDSYVKWGAALASTLTDAWTARLVILASPVMPSGRQLADALAGTRFTTGEVDVVHLDDLDALLDEEGPHAVLLSLRGPFVRVVAPILQRREDRPALLSGFPGLTIPAVPKAVAYREQTDLIVLHSRREVREFAANALELGVDPALGLATLPFLATGAGGSVGAADPSSRSDPRGEVVPAASDGDVVFAAQAKVPAQLEDRMRVLEALAEHARRNPERRVIVKVRARRGEAQTHREEHDYGELVDELGPVAPPNLVVEHGPMAAKLARAGALVTVSSTAALEAVAMGLPVLLIDDFGVSPAMINTVFEGSGLFGSTHDLVAGRFRRAAPAWTADNYFHGTDGDDWTGRLDALVAAREIVPLPPIERRHDTSGGALRAAYERRRMLGRYDRDPLGTVAWAFGVAARTAVRRARRLRRWLQGSTDAATGRAGSVDGRGVLLDVPQVGGGVAADAHPLRNREHTPDLAGHARDE
jgi:hypothetical protein